MLTRNLFPLLVATLLGAQAFANDSGIAVVDVLGIEPGANLNSTVEIYGGDTKALYDVLPTTSVGNWKDVSLASRNYVVEIRCHQEYTRPTNHEHRNDYLCSLGVKNRRDSSVDHPDVDTGPVDEHSFTPYTAASMARVLGINPHAAPGLLFSFYGNQAALLAEALPSRLAFDSAQYRVQIDCQREYPRPSNGEWRTDSMCSTNLIRK